GRARVRQATARVAGDRAVELGESERRAARAESWRARLHSEEREPADATERLAARAQWQHLYSAAARAHHAAAARFQQSAAAAARDQSAHRSADRCAAP